MQPTQPPADQLEIHTPHPLPHLPERPHPPPRHTPPCRSPFFEAQDIRGNVREGRMDHDSIRIRGRQAVKAERRRRKCRHRTDSCAPTYQPPQSAKISGNKTSTPIIVKKFRPNFFDVGETPVERPINFHNQQNQATKILTQIQNSPLREGPPKKTFFSPLNV